MMEGWTGPLGRGLAREFGTVSPGLLPGGGGGAPLGFTELEMLCVVGLGLGDTLGEEFYNIMVVNVRFNQFKYLRKPKI